MKIVFWLLSSSFAFAYLMRLWNEGNNAYVKTPFVHHFWNVLILKKKSWKFTTSANYLFKKRHLKQFDLSLTCVFLHEKTTKKSSSLWSKEREWDTMTTREPQPTKRAQFQHLFTSARASVPTKETNLEWLTAVAKVISFQMSPKMSRFEVRFF